MLPYFLHFCPIEMKFGAGYICRSVREYAYGERRYFTCRGSKLIVFVVYHVCCQIWVRSVCEFYVQSSSALKFRENHYREDSAFPTGVSGTRLRVCAVEQRYSDCNERLGDVCSASLRKQYRSPTDCTVVKAVQCVCTG
jgi:hypothetical protein